MWKHKSKQRVNFESRAEIYCNWSCWQKGLYIIYIKIGQLSDKLNEKVLKLLIDQKNKEFNKTKLYKYDVEDNLIIINAPFDRILIRTIKNIDDIIDKFLRKYNMKFNITVSGKKDFLIKRNHENVLFTNYDNILEKSLEELSDLFSSVIIKNNEIECVFDFTSSFAKSEIINLVTKRGNLNLQIYKIESHNLDFSVVWKGDLNKIKNIRIHHMCETSEIFDSIHCDCKKQLEAFKDIMWKEGGMILYGHEEGRGFGIFNKVNAYYKTEKFNLDTKGAMNEVIGKSENRKFDIPAEIIRQIGISDINLWTNNPKKIFPLEDRNIKVKRMNAWYECESQEANTYIKDKIKKMGHIC